MLCIVRLQRMANCLDTGNRVFVFGRKTGKKRKEKDKKKKLPRNRLTFYTRANEAPSSPEFRLHVNPETDDGDSFRRDFSNWFSACLAVEIILRSPCKTRVSFPSSIFPLYLPHTFSLTYDGILSIHHGYRTGIRPPLIRNIEFSRPSEERHFLFHYFHGHTAG